MKAIHAINLALGFFMLFWAAISDTRTFALASDLADELRAGSPKVQPIEYADLVRLLRRATQTDAAVCAVAGGALIATSSLGLWLNVRRPPV